MTESSKNVSQVNLAASSAKSSLSGLGIVVVLYMLPMSDLLPKLLDYVALGARLFVVDNTPFATESNADMSEPNIDGVRYIRFGRNEGIGSALNTGIRAAFNDGQRYVVTFDQDSSMSGSNLAQLYSKYKELEEAGFQNFALGPLPFNRKTGASYLRRLARIRFVIQNSLALWKRSKSNCLVTREIITSGLMASRHTYAFNGLYNEELFIDYVDHEWCWRLASAGGFSAIDCSIRLSHMVGHGELPFLGGIKISAPWRSYFLFRNGIYLCMTRRMPMFDSLKLLFLVPFKTLAFAFMPQPRARLFFMYRGIRDGFLMTCGLGFLPPKALAIARSQ